MLLFTVGKAIDGSDLSKEAAMGGGFYTKPGSGKDKRTLQSVKTHFYVGTEVLLLWTTRPSFALSLGGRAAGQSRTTPHPSSVQGGAWGLHIEHYVDESRFPVVFYFWLAQHQCAVWSTLFCVELSILLRLSIFLMHIRRYPQFIQSTTPLAFSFSHSKLFLCHLYAYWYILLNTDMFIFGWSVNTEAFPKLVLQLFLKYF